MGNQTIGLVLGKFMPLHKGHELLLNFATHYVDTLYVIVDNIVDAPILGPVRCAWIEQILPNAKVYYIPKPLPQHPHEHPNFWAMWQHSLLALLPEKPDYIFASEPYGFKLAEVLEAMFIPFDCQRKMMPISATQIRHDPLTHWHYLSSPAKLFYLKRICLFGPESSGKTTLAKALADHFKTRWVPEYARTLIESKGKLEKEDMLLIAKGQLALEETIAPLANKILICDTDPLATTLWSKWLFQENDEEILRLAHQKKYDLYLLTSPDIEWESDEARYFPEKSQAFFNECIETLDAQNRHYAIVSGNGQERLQCAIQCVENYLRKLMTC